MTIKEGVIECANSTALAVAPSAGLAMHMTTAEAVKRLKELRSFIKKVMIKGEDYGEIPGISKPTLLQPGAQKLAEIYGLHPKWEWVEVVKDWDRLFFYFEAKCRLLRIGDDAEIGEGTGSCNSKETKYAGRWVPASDVPSHLDADTLEKRTGFAWVFQKDIPKDVDPSSVERRDLVSKKPPYRPYSQWRVALPTYLIPNADLASQVNTMQKIAMKRALVMAVIGATRSSGIFTQDVEDLPKGAIKVDEETETPAAPAAPPAGGKRGKKPAPASTLLSPDDQQVLALELIGRIHGAPDVEGLRAVHTQINGHRLEVDAAIFKDLAEELKKAKAKLEAGLSSPETTTDGNAAWGVDEKPPPGAGDAWEPRDPK